MNNQGKFEWDIKEISKALKISEEDVKIYFKDGRRISFLLERRLCKEVFHGKLAESEGAGFDLVDAEGKKWEVRSISQGGIYFCPSYMVGSGRTFNEQGFLEKLDDIKGYIISDIESFPNIPFWIILKEQVRNWWKRKELGSTTTKISREKMLYLLKNAS